MSRFTEGERTSNRKDVRLFTRLRLLFLGELWLGSRGRIETRWEGSASLRLIMEWRSCLLLSSSHADLFQQCPAHLGEGKGEIYAWVIVLNFLFISLPASIYLLAM